MQYILFPLSILITPFKILYRDLRIALFISLGKDQKKRESKIKEIKKNSDLDILKLKKEFFKSSQTVISYSLMLLLEINLPYYICFFIGKYHSILNLYISPEAYSSISVGIVSFVVTLMLTLKISIREIESGEEFLSNLFEHCNSLTLYLKKKNLTVDKNNPVDPRNILNIITPNINLGSGLGSNHFISLSELINDNQAIIFRFLCLPVSLEYLKDYENQKETTDKHYYFKNAIQNNSHQLDYIYRRRNYSQNGNANDLDNLIKEIIELREKPNVVICNIKNIEEFNDQKMVGYISCNECVLGKYYDSEDSVLIKGELVNTQEFIYHINKYIINAMANPSSNCDNCKLKSICPID